MSDEKKVEKTHTETVATESPAEERPKAFGFMNPVVFLLFMIFAMVVVLVVVSTKRSNGGSNTETEVDDPAIASRNRLPQGRHQSRRNGAQPPAHGHGSPSA